MKSVYILTDLEGVAGVVSFETQISHESRYYEQARRLLTAEVNVAVEALAAGGVTQLLVADGHGLGAICYEELHRNAELIHGRPITIPQLLSPAEKCDAAIVIGQHAMAGTARGSLNHTQNSKTIEEIRLNGTAIGELAQFALYVGSSGVPVIFVSGDEAACREAEALIPGIVTASVKKGLGRNCAISVAVDESHRRIREGVSKALQSHEVRPIVPLKWPDPYVLEKRFFHTDSADQAETAPGALRVDDRTVRITSDDDIRGLIYR